jgi:transglutaminase/protease-like cytokinesis protein 3
LATYRLLDPRRRANPWQRIQLIRPLNREDRQTPSSPSNSLWSQTEPASSLGDAESDQIPQIGSSPSSPSSQEPSGWINRQVIDRALEQTASQATLVDSNHDARSWLEERREIVRTLKSSEDNMSRDKRQEKSTLSWLLSVFGR